MHYIVVWTCGSCNYGDHDHGWESFDTVEAANKKVEDLIERNSDGGVIIIFGEVTLTHNWGM